MSFHLYDTDIFVLAGTTTRVHGKSEGVYSKNNLGYTVGDDPAIVTFNRETLAKQINTTLNDWIFVKQCHSDQFKKVSTEDKGRGSYSFEDGIEQVDALYSFDKRLVLSFFHADCVPVLFYDRTTHLIGAIHAGYDGTLSEITKKTLSHVIHNEKVKPENIQVIIGPALSYKNSNMKVDITQRLNDMTVDTTDCYTKLENGHFKIDTRTLNKRMVLECGIPLENIHDYDHDTFEDSSLYYSYERDGQTGRHLSFITQV